MKLNNKGFSLVEILITVGLIGTLTAIAVPSYQKYQASAKVTVVQSSISRIKGAFAACLATDSFDNCATADISGTLQSQSGANIRSTGAAGTPLKVCWEVSLANPADGTGCVDFINNNTGKPDEEKSSFPLGTPCSNFKCTVTANSCNTGCTSVGCTDPTVPPGTSDNTQIECDGTTSTSAANAATCSGGTTCS